MSEREESPIEASGQDLVGQAVGRQFFEREPITLANHGLSSQEIWELLGTRLTSHRQQRIRQVCRQRCQSLVPVLENIYDRGNISAVMRSAEAFGFYQFHVVEKAEAKFKAANRVTQGTDKWLKVERHRQASSSITKLKDQGYRVLATHLEASVPIEEIDFTQKVAVVFGNEKDGVSDEMLDLVDGRFIYPMQGFAQSFNISVAAALTFSFAYWQRVQKLGKCGDLTEPQQDLLAANYVLRSLDNVESLVRHLKG
jgi:tRNA (guanosine-2'-O-)-methyltransferase